MKEIWIKNITAILFGVLVITGFVMNGSFSQVNKISQALINADPGTWSVQGLENEYVESMWKKKDLVDLNGAMARKLGMKGFYSDLGIFVTDNGYILSDADRTTTEFEYNETIDLKKYLDERGINLIYVNKPTKYLDDSIFEDRFGLESYCNRNADLFLERIREAGVNTIDLRDGIKADNLSIEDMFYRTDHHWTVRSGLWAVQRIAEGLDEYCGYDIDPHLYDIDNYTVESYDDCWLGEQGGKIGESYVGLDGFEVIRPAFETDYTFFTDDGSEYEDTFNSFMDDAYYALENRSRHDISWHYSYKARNSINRKVDKGNVLILGDSYDMVTVPFLSLSVHKLDYLDLRGTDENFSLKDYIEQNDYDTVIISYVQFMIGAHDDPSSSNYRIFAFQ